MAEEQTTGGEQAQVCPRCNQPIEPGASTEIQADKSRTHDLQTCFNNVKAENDAVKAEAKGKKEEEKPQAAPAKPEEKKKSSSEDAY